METVLLQELVAGPRHATEIAMTRSSRTRIARRLEAENLLQRDNGTYSLTPAGLRYAIGQGIMPPPAAYFTDIPANADLPTGPIDMAAIRRQGPADLAWVEWFCWVSIIASLLAGTELVIMKITHYF